MMGEGNYFGYYYCIEAEQGIAEVQNLNFKKYKDKKYGGSEDETAVVQELNGKYKNNSYTEKNYIYLSTLAGVDAVDDGMDINN